MSDVISSKLEKARSTDGTGSPSLLKVVLDNKLVSLSLAQKKIGSFYS